MKKKKKKADQGTLTALGEKSKDRADQSYKKIENMKKKKNFI